MRPAEMNVAVADLAAMREARVDVPAAVAAEEIVGLDVLHPAVKRTVEVDGLGRDPLAVDPETLDAGPADAEDLLAHGLPRGSAGDEVDRVGQLEGVAALGLDARVLLLDVTLGGAAIVTEPCGPLGIDREAWILVLVDGDVVADAQLAGIRHRDAARSLRVAGGDRQVRPPGSRPGHPDGCPVSEDERGRARIGRGKPGAPRAARPPQDDVGLQGDVRIDPVDAGRDGDDAPVRGRSDTGVDRGGIVHRPVRMETAARGDDIVGRDAANGVQAGVPVDPAVGRDLVVGAGGRGQEKERHQNGPAQCARSSRRSRAG